MADNRVIVNDKGADRLLKQLAPRAEVADVGVLGNAGSAQHGDSGTTVAQIAAFQEFGTINIPSRSWLRVWVDTNQRQIRQVRDRLYRQVVQGKITQKQALTQLGLWIEGQVVERISDNIPPPLDEATVAKKGSDVALIDTGQFRSSITSVVRKP